MISMVGKKDLFLSPWRLWPGNGVFELVREARYRQLSSASGHLFREYRWIIRVFQPGNYQLGPVPVYIFRQDGSRDTLDAAPLDIAVSLPKPGKDSLQIRPIRDIWEERPTWQDALPLFSLLGCLFLSALFWLFWRRRKKEPEIPRQVAPSPHSPAALALERMAWLAKQRFIQENDLVNYHYELGIIFRTFLERQFGVKVLDLPGSDVLEVFQNLPGDIPCREFLTQWIREAEWVKFARANPPAFFHETSFKTLMLFFQSFCTEENDLQGKESPSSYD